MSSTNLLWVRTYPFTRQYLGYSQRPYRVAATDASGNLYVVSTDDWSALTLHKFDENGNYIYKIGGGFSAPPHMKNVDNATVVIDSSGFVCIAYATNGTQSGGTNLGGGQDIVVMKLSSSGVVQWVKQMAAMNTTAQDMFPSIYTDASNNVIVAYTTHYGTASGGTNVGKDDIVVFKLNSNGTMLWIKQTNQFNTNDADYDASIVTDSSNNIYGTYYGRGHGTNWTTAIPSFPIVSATYTIAGVPITYTLLSATSLKIACVAITGRIYYTTTDYVYMNWPSDLGGFVSTTGQNLIGDTYTKTVSVTFPYSGYIKFTNLDGTTIYGTQSFTMVPIGSTKTGGYDIVVFKMDPEGTVTWIRQTPPISTTSNDLEPNLAIDLSNNLYLTYQTVGTVSGGTLRGGIDVVISKLTTDGTVAWVKQNGNVNSMGSATGWGIFNPSGQDYDPRVAVDSLGNSFVVFNSNGTASGGTLLGSGDITLAKFDSNGTLTGLWQNASLSTNKEDILGSVVVGPDNSVYLIYNSHGVISGSTLAADNSRLVLAKLSAAGAPAGGSGGSGGTAASTAASSIVYMKTYNLSIKMHNSMTMS